jgi:hypothetical protein
MITDINQLDLNKTYSYGLFNVSNFRKTGIDRENFKMSPAKYYSSTNFWKSAWTSFNFFKPHPCNLFAAPFDVRLIDKRKSREIYLFNLICV